MNENIKGFIAWAVMVTLLVTLGSCVTTTAKIERELRTPQTPFPGERESTKEWTNPNPTPSKLVPRVGNIMDVYHGCETWADLEPLRPILRMVPSLKKRRVLFHTLRKPGSRCLDTVTQGHHQPAAQVRLQELVAQDPIKRGFMVQYWRATFGDGVEMFTWFFIQVRVM